MNLEIIFKIWQLEIHILKRDMSNKVTYFSKRQLGISVLNKSSGRGEEKSITFIVASI